MTTSSQQIQHKGSKSEIQQAELERVFARYGAEPAQAGLRQIIRDVEQGQLVREARKARSDFFYSVLKQGWLKLGLAAGALKGFKHTAQENRQAIKRTT